MLVKIGKKQFDSARLPVAFVLSPQEKQIFYNMIQDHLLNRRHLEMAFYLGPHDIPREIAADWLASVTGKEKREIYSHENR